MTSPLLGRVSLALLRDAVDGFTVDAVSDLLGPLGRAAHQRGDLVAVSRALPSGERLATLIRLFLLGEAVPESEARSALRPLDLAAAGELVEVDGDRARARLELRPVRHRHLRPVVGVLRLRLGRSARARSLPTMCSASAGRR